MSLATAYVQLMAQDGPLKATLSSLQSWVAAQGERIRQSLSGLDPKIGGEAADGAEKLGDSLEDLGQAASEATPQLGGLIGKIAAFISVQKLVGVFSFGVNAAAEAETASIAFNTIIKDTERTKKLLEELNQFSVVTPFTPTEVREAGLALVAAKRPLEGIRDDLKMLGDVASASPKASLGEMVAIFNKINSQGKLTAETFEQFTNQGINLMPELAAMLGKTETQIRAMMSAGQITAPVMERLFKRMTSEGGTFYNSMSRQSSTFAGLTSTLTGVMTDLGRSLGELLLPVMKGIVSIAIAAGNALLWLDDATFGLSTAVIALASVLAAVNVTLWLTGTTMAGLAATTIAATASLWAFVAASWAAVAPFMPIILAVIGVAAALYLLYKVFQPIIDGLISVGKAVVGGLLYPFRAAFGAIADALSPIFDAIGVLSEAFGEVGTALNDVMGQVSGILGSLSGGVVSGVMKLLALPLKIIASLLGLVIRGVAAAISFVAKVIEYLGKAVDRVAAGLDYLWKKFEGGFRSIFGDFIGDMIFGKAEKNVAKMETSALATAEALKSIKPGFFDFDKLGREVQMKLLSEGTPDATSDSDRLDRIGDLADASKATQEKSLAVLEEMRDMDKERAKPEVATA